MNAQTDALTPKQLRAIDALLDGASKQDTADRAGVTVRTLNRWLQLPPFTDAMRRALDRSLLDTTRKAAVKAGRAVDVLGELMDDDTAPTSQRIRAAGLLIDAAVRLRDQVDILDRLEMLEGLLDDETPPTHRPRHTTGGWKTH